jgi:hypothetical protein
MVSSLLRGGHSVSPPALTRVLLLLAVGTCVNPGGPSTIELIGFVVLACAMEAWGIVTCTVSGAGGSAIKAAVPGCPPSALVPIPSLSGLCGMALSCLSPIGVPLR